MKTIFEAILISSAGEKIDSWEFTEIDYRSCLNGGRFIYGKTDKGALLILVSEKNNFIIEEKTK